MKTQVLERLNDVLLKARDCSSQVAAHGGKVLSQKNLIPHQGMIYWGYFNVS
jgi:hypothetical protein